jgi:uncharacterized membrane protein
MIGLIITLLASVGCAAAFVWFADWTTRERHPTALNVLNRRLARGEIDRPEYDEKRNLIGGNTGAS